MLVSVVVKCLPDSQSDCDVSVDMRMTVRELKNVLREKLTFLRNYLPNDDESKENQKWREYVVLREDHGGEQLRDKRLVRDYCKDGETLVLWMDLEKPFPLRCPLCDEVFIVGDVEREPRLLLCGHSLCWRCICEAMTCSGNYERTEFSETKTMEGGEACSKERREQQRKRRDYEYQRSELAKKRETEKLVNVFRLVCPCKGCEKVSYLKKCERAEDWPVHGSMQELLNLKREKQLEDGVNDEIGFCSKNGCPERAVVFCEECDSRRFCVEHCRETHDGIETHAHHHPQLIVTHLERLRLKERGEGTTLTRDTLVDLDSLKASYDNGLNTLAELSKSLEVIQESRLMGEKELRRHFDVLMHRLELRKEWMLRELRRICESREDEVLKDMKLLGDVLGKVQVNISHNQEINRDMTPLSTTIGLDESGASKHNSAIALCCVGKVDEFASWLIRSVEVKESSHGTEATEIQTLIPNTTDVANLNRTDEHERSGLHLVATHNCCSLDLLKDVLARGAPIDPHDEYGDTPLYTAALNNRIEILEELLASGASVDFKNKEGETPLHAACRIGSESVVKALLEADAVIDTPNNVGLTPLHAAVNASVVRELLYAGADPDPVDKDNLTPLFHACYSGNEEIVNELLAAGANVNIPNKDGISPLHAAVWANRLKIARKLLEAGAVVNSITNDGVCPLFIAASKGCTEMVNLLLTAHTALATNTNCMPLCIAAAEGKLEVVRMLIKEGVPVEDEQGFITPLYCAAESGFAEVVRELLLAGANVDPLTKDGVSPLCIAAFQGHAAVVAELLRARASVDRIDKNGYTSLHAATSKGFPDVVQLLLASGAETNVMSKTGESPLYCAVLAQHFDVVAVILPAAGESFEKLPGTLQEAVNASLRGDDAAARSLVQNYAESAQLQVHNCHKNVSSVVGELRQKLSSCPEARAQAAMIESDVSCGIGTAPEIASSANDLVESSEPSCLEHDATGKNDELASTLRERRRQSRWQRYQQLAHSGCRIVHLFSSPVDSVKSSLGRLDALKAFRMIADGLGNLLDSACQFPNVVFRSIPATSNNIEMLGKQPFDLALISGHFDDTSQFCYGESATGGCISWSRSELERMFSGWRNAVSCLVLGFSQSEAIAEWFHKKLQIPHVICVRSGVRQEEKAYHILFREMTRCLLSGCTVDTSFKRSIQRLREHGFANGSDAFLLLPANDSIHKEVLLEEVFLSCVMRGVSDLSSVPLIPRHSSNAFTDLYQALVSSTRGLVMLHTEKGLGGTTTCWELARYLAPRNIFRFISYLSLKSGESNLGSIKETIEEGKIVLRSGSDRLLIILDNCSSSSDLLLNEIFSVAKNVSVLIVCSPNFTLPKFDFRASAVNLDVVQLEPMTGEEIARLIISRSPRAIRLEEILPVAEYEMMIKDGIEMKMIVDEALKLFSASSVVRQLNGSPARAVEFAAKIDSRPLDEKAYFSEMTKPTAGKEAYRGEASQVDNAALSEAGLAGATNAESLHEASFNGQLDVVRKLLDLGVPVDPRDKYGAAPLFYASQEGHMKVVHLLLAHGADVNTVNQDGRTPLWTAAFNDHEDVVDVLVSHSADVNAKDKSGLSILFVAVENGNHSLVSYLLKAGARIDGIEQALVSLALKNGSTDIVTLLQEHCGMS